jgi:hypothetical protein
MGFGMKKLEMNFANFQVKSSTRSTSCDPFAKLTLILTYHKHVVIS